MTSMKTLNKSKYANRINAQVGMLLSDTFHEYLKDCGYDFQHRPIVNGHQPQFVFHGKQSGIWLFITPRATKPILESYSKFDTENVDDIIVVSLIGDSNATYINGKITCITLDTFLDGQHAPKDIKKEYAVAFDYLKDIAETSYAFKHANDSSNYVV